MSTSTIIQVSQPNDVTIRIDLTIHNGQPHVVTMQQSGVHHQYQLQHQQQQHQQQQQQLPSTSSQIEELMRGIRTLNVCEEPTDHFISRRTNRLLESLTAQSPPPKLNYENRRRKAAAVLAAAAAARPQVIGIPDVPDSEDSEDIHSSNHSTEEDIDENTAGLARSRRSSSQVLLKAPEKAFITATGMSKLAHSGIDGDDDGHDMMLELEDKGYDEHRDDDAERRRRKRQPSSAATIASAGSPYQSNASHVSASPPAFQYHAGAPTPPSNEEQQMFQSALCQQQQHPSSSRFPYGTAAYGETAVSQQQHQAYRNQPVKAHSAATTTEKRKRGRPRKVIDPTAAAGPPDSARASVQLQQQQQQKLQPRRQTASASFFVATASFQRSSAATDFISSEELQDAARVISKIEYSELITGNEYGDLLCHKLAREGNWAKVVALNLRLLSSPSFGDIFAGINAHNNAGRTVLLEAVEQQNAQAVAYCCLFTSGSDSLLLRALAEAALLPVNDVCDEIFMSILDTMCQEVDVNCNETPKSSNRYINSPIDSYTFTSADRYQFRGLTVLQLLTLQPAQWHSRLSKLITYGANPRCPIGQTASATYRPFSEPGYLAARFSPAPLDCLKTLGMSLREVPVQGLRLAFDWDADCQVSEGCAKIIAPRTDLSSDDKNYTTSLLQSKLPELKEEMVEEFLLSSFLDDFAA